MRAIGVAAALSVFCSSLAMAADYFPLREDNQWTYSMSSGAQMTTTIAGFTAVGTVRCAIVETTIGWQKSREYLAVDVEGVKAYMSLVRGQEFRYDPPVLRIKLPYREGDKWTAVAHQFGISVTTDFQSIGKERLQTPAGTFDCIKVRSAASMMPGQPPVVSIHFYADGVGPVHQIMQAGGQEMTATLAATNVKPSQQAPAAPRPRTTLPIRCPKCGAQVVATAKFCPECGQRTAAPAPASEPNRPSAPAVAGPPSLEKYQSPDGKVLLYKPRGWNVAQGDLFGPGTYGVTVREPQENAVVLFFTFAVGPDVKDSVGLAARCITALRHKYPDLRATNIHSTPTRERTITDLTLTADGEKGAGHGYFFHARDIGSAYILLAKTKAWNEFRPTLTTIAANLAYAPQGVAAVQEQGRQAAQPASAAQSAIPPLAAMIRQASQQPGRQIPLQLAALTDQSLSLQIPEGWTLEGAEIQYAVVNNAQTRTHGIGSLWLTILPTDIPVPGVINVRYQPPPQALKIVLESGRSTREVQVISECPVEQAVPESTPLIQQMRSQGFEVDARLVHAKFRNVPTGLTCRGLFCVVCSVKPLSPVWQISLQGSWAPDREYEEWLPLFLRVEKTAQVNPQWRGEEMQNQALRQQQLNRHLQKSLAESSRAFDDPMKTVRDGSRNRDYIRRVWSQTTLGQGIWVAENEGATVYQTDSWGLEDPEGRIDSRAYNTTNFTGESSRAGGRLELVDTRAEYERYIANP